MNNIQVEQLSDRLKNLGEFTKDKSGSYKESEIIDWISECVNIFYEIGVDSVIIRNFLDHFRSGIEVVDYKDMFGKEESLRVNIVGPFQEEVSGSQMFRHKTGNYILAGSFYYAKVAFSSARNTLKNKVAEKRIVPLWLIGQIATQDKVQHLASSLELIENKYENNDAQGLVTESITLLGSVLDLDPDLLVKGSIGNKLKSLIENGAKLETFGVSKDLVIGLNCGRILRNEKIVHKDIPIKYEFPFLIATSFAYLVLFFVECAILNGEVIKY